MATWHPVVGFERFYEVSDEGQIRRTAPSRGAKVGVPRKLQANKGRDYLMCRLCGERGQHKYVYVATVVCEAFHGPRPSGMQVNHKNGIRTDNRATNLEWMTPKENTRHRFDVLDKQNARGEEHGNTSLSNNDVAQMKALLKAGASNGFVARQFDASLGVVKSIRAGRNWGHIAASAVAALRPSQLSRPCGESHYQSKLTADAVRDIRSSSERGSVLAKQYGVSQTMIANVRKGKVWKHVK